jgi:hypothetical protein
VEPNQVRGPFLVYTGTRDGNMMGVLKRQRPAIEASRVTTDDETSFVDGH